MFNKSLFNHLSAPMFSHISHISHIVLFNNLCNRVVDSLDLDIFIPSPLFAKMFIGQGTAVNATISSTSKTCVSKCGLGNGDEQRWTAPLYPGWWFQSLWKIIISQLGWLYPIYGKIKNVPNHQSVYHMGCNQQKWEYHLHGIIFWLKKISFTNLIRPGLGLVTPY